MIQNESLNKAKTLSTIFHLPIPPPILFVYLFVCVFGFFGTMALRMCTTTELNKSTQITVWFPYATEKSRVIETEKLEHQMIWFIDRMR